MGSCDGHVFLQWLSCDGKGFGADGPAALHKLRTPPRLHATGHVLHKHSLHPTTLSAASSRLHVYNAGPMNCMYRVHLYLPHPTPSYPHPAPSYPHPTPRPRCLPQPVQQVQRRRRRDKGPPEPLPGIHGAVQGQYACLIHQPEPSSLSLAALGSQPEPHSLSLAFTHSLSPTA
eukprot:366102-Chlamydomonas_euryale.AAC.7